MMHAPAPAAFAVSVAACALVGLQGCGPTTPAPSPESLPEYECAGGCHIHTECEPHGDHDHVHYEQHGCAMSPTAPSGSCAAYAEAWGAMTAEEKQCHTATLCCAASDGNDTASCATKDSSECTPETPAPSPAPSPELPEYECAGGCHIHTECEPYGDHDHVHYEQHGCAMSPTAPSGSCAAYSTAWGAMTAEEKQCHTATLCCAASDGNDTASCE